MIKEIVIVAIAILGLCHAATVHEPKPEQKKIPVPVPVEEPSGALESDDLAPEASAYDSYGGKRYGGGSRHWGNYKGHGGGSHWGGQRGHVYKGHGGYSG